MAETSIKFDVVLAAGGKCTECGEALDLDRLSIWVSVDGNEWMRFHQVCAWQRASFMFWKLF